MNPLPPPIVIEQDAPPIDFDALPEAIIPTWVKVSAAVTGALVILSFVRLPISVRAELANTRGDRALAAGRADEAANQFRIVLATYPKSKQAILSAAEAYLNANRNREAEETLGALEGRELTDEEYRRADTVDAALERRYKELVDKQGQAKP